MKTFSKAFIYTLFVILLLFSTAGLVSASNLPGLSDKAHIICYPLNTTSRTYAVSAENRYIDPGDECYITAIDGNRIYISYPTSKGRHSEWFNRDAFSVADLANANFPTITAPRKITTYKNAVGSDSFIKYNNMLITPEQLGNMVYGHFGRAWGFGCSSLIFGGDVVATATDLTWGDDPSDKAYIERGFYHFGE